MLHGHYKRICLVELVQENRKRSSLEVQRRRRKLGEENFGIPKSSDIGRSLNSILGRFRKFGPWNAKIKLFH